MTWLGKIVAKKCVLGKKYVVFGLRKNGLPSLQNILHLRLGASDFENNPTFFLEYELAAKMWVS